jgi:predicted ArsR family transcriptional regulator
MRAETERGVHCLAALEDDLRRRMYLLATSRPGGVTREEVAAELGVSRNLAAFHLDKLVERGLLSAAYRDPGGRRPRVGRKPKVYQRGGEIAVSLPERRYELLATVLLRALKRAGAGGSPLEAAKDAAFAAGRKAASEARDGPVRDLRAVLEANGFEPDERQGTIRLRNCPFHALAAQDPALVCGLNQAFVAGLISGSREGASAVLSPSPPNCCVLIEKETA